MNIKKYVKFLGIIIFVFILWKIDLGEMIRVLSQIKILFFVCALALVFPLMFIKSFRWNVLLKSQGISYRLSETYKVYMSSLYFGFITPGRLGEFIKAFYVRQDKNVSVSRGMSSVLVDRMFDMYVLLLVGTFGLWRFNVLGNLSLTYVLLLILIALLPLFLLNKRIMKKPVSLLYRIALIKKHEDRIKNSFNDFYDGINELINTGLIFAFLLTCLSYLLFFFQCYLLLNSLDISINFLDITLIMGVSNLISLMPLSISGLGTRDAVLIFFFSLLGFDPEWAVSYAFLVFLSFFVFGGLLGAVAWWLKPLRVKNFSSAPGKKDKISGVNK
jgi:uncharacterized protein (TIRG00374 family)